MKTIFEEHKLTDPPKDSLARLGIRLSVLAGWGFFIYCLLRAFFVDITHDEAYTFQHFVRNTLWQVVSQQGTNLNNHMLNTVVVKLSYLLFGSHVFFLRLPSLIFFGLFLVYTFRLLRNTLSGILLLPAFLIIISNPFLLDFFSLARGYAGSFACMMAALYYTGEYISGRVESKRNLFIIALLSSLTVLFHFSMLNFLLPFAGVFIMWLFLKTLLAEDGKKQFLKRFFSLTWRPLLVYILVLAYIIPIVIRFKNSGDFDFSVGEDKYLSDTVASILNSASYFKLPYLSHDRCVSIFWPIVSGTMIFWGIIFVLGIFRKGSIRLSPMPFFTWILLVVIALCIVLQHVLLKSSYPIDRFVLFVWPFLVMLFIYLFDLHFLKNKYFLLVPCGITILFLANFANAANLNSALDWTFDANAESVINYLEKIHKKHPGEDMNVGCFWKMEPSLNYYRFDKKIYWLRGFLREDLNRRQEYFYILTGEKHGLPTQKVSAVYENYSAGMTLFRNDDRDTSAPILEAGLEPGALSTSYKGKPCMITEGWPKTILEFKNLPANTEYIAEACLTAHFDNSKLGNKQLTLAIDNEVNGPANFWKCIDFNVSVINGGEAWQKIYMSCIIPAHAVNEGTLNALVDNYEGRKLCISDLKIRIYRK